MASMTGKFTFGSGDTRDTPEFNLFFDQQASYPFYSDGIWFLTQMRRWGQIAEDKTDPNPWPEERFVRFGAKAQAWVQLDTVPVGYEIWRQLNNFPPELPVAEAPPAPQ